MDATLGQKTIDIKPIKVELGEIDWNRLDAASMLETYEYYKDRDPHNLTQEIITEISSAFENPTEEKLNDALNNLDHRFFKIIAVIDLVRLFGAIKMKILLDELNFEETPFGIKPEDIENKSIDDIFLEIKNFFEGFNQAEHKLEYLAYILCLLDYAKKLSITEG